MAGFAGLVACAGVGGSEQELAHQGGGDVCVSDDSGRSRGCAPGDDKKTTICHVPPGNPSNAHTLCVGNAAVPAHLAHGDSLGECNGHPACPPDGGSAPTVDLGHDFDGPIIF